MRGRRLTGELLANGAGGAEEWIAATRSLLSGRLRTRLAVFVNAAGEFLVLQAAGNGRQCHSMCSSEKVNAYDEAPASMVFAELSPSIVNTVMGLWYCSSSSLFVLLYLRKPG